jgi:hypothetical protein
MWTPSKKDAGPDMDLGLQLHYGKKFTKLFWHPNPMKKFTKF